jgi:hypothetical protein
MKIINLIFLMFHVIAIGVSLYFMYENVAFWYWFIIGLVNACLLGMQLSIIMRIKP